MPAVAHRGPSHHLVGPQGRGCKGTRGWGQANIHGGCQSHTRRETPDGDTENGPLQRRRGAGMEVSVSGWGWGSRNSSPPAPRHQSTQDRAQAAAREVSEDTWGRRTTGHGRLMTGPQGQQPEDPGGAFVIKGSTAGWRQPSLAGAW